MNREICKTVWAGDLIMGGLINESRIDSNTIFEFEFGVAVSL